MMSASTQPILSPCIGICELGSDGYCVGCHRTGDEIARWLSMSDSERRFFMEHTLAEREAARR
jgi:predicted Fe-S protein YdhL (DUF1289 family)